MKTVTYHNGKTASDCPAFVVRDPYIDDKDKPQPAVLFVLSPISQHTFWVTAFPGKASGQYSEE